MSGPVAVTCPVCRIGSVRVDLLTGDYPEDPNRQSINDVDAECSCLESPLVNEAKLLDELLEAAVMA